jgi:hypothetical protein
VPFGSARAAGLYLTEVVQIPYSSADPNSFVAVGMQSALGTAQTTLTKLRYAKYLSGTGFQAQLEINPLREGGDGLDHGYTYKKSQKVAGQLVVNARPEIAAQLLQLVPGGATWDGASAPALHTFHTGHASHPWSTLYAQFPGSALAQMLTDVRYTGLTAEWESGEPLKLTLPFLAIQHGASYNTTLAVPSYAVEDPFVYHFGPSYQIDGAADADIVGFKYELGLGVEELYSQSINPDEIVVQNRDITVEIRRRFESSALWQKIVMGGTSAITPTQTVATGSLDTIIQYGSGAALRSMRMVAPLIDYTGNDLGELDPDGRTVIEVISGIALKGATHALLAYVRNAHASAYAP